MPQIDVYNSPKELVLGLRHNERVPAADQDRQRAEVEEILRRFQGKPGVVLADEVGMGKTFVALAVAYSIAAQSRSTSGCRTSRRSANCIWKAGHPSSGTKQRRESFGMLPQFVTGLPAAALS